MARSQQVVVLCTPSEKDQLQAGPARAALEACIQAAGLTDPSISWNTALAGLDEYTVPNWVAFVKKLRQSLGGITMIKLIIITSGAIEAGVFTRSIGDLEEGQRTEAVAGITRAVTGPLRLLEGMARAKLPKFAYLRVPA
ncbi:MAG TPA: hypothetical protein VI322_00540 [Candidatus Saccharimonadia bacterium]